ncbi:hypothetical protein BDA96_02G177800 [Sorghum bicolor]|jgi:hypothetical protein|uniref:Uncharacterized protein n=2 Tax=Sorghum bicolor TaxID=4558 RepID=A0A921UVS0_SORBI|nr:hypothetical protein BDA96_02G177800 [Sorghum bicolor]KXG35405.1 hypothetical protein SORBI_3002G169500 [Sorghum bicolor]
MEKIGEGVGSSVSVPMPCDRIGEGGATSVPIPKMCAGGVRQKEAMKVGVSGGDGSLEHVINIGRSRLRVDHRSQLYVLDLEDEGIGMEVGLYVPNSEEDGGSHGYRRRQLCRCAWLAVADVGGYKRAHAVVA